jgi:dihydrodipicolinate synthase/N-acetylneuraminate lyase
MSSPNASAKFGGIIVPMASPFTADGRIDRPAAARIVHHLVAGGVQGVFILGTMGEGLSMPLEERVALVAATSEALAQSGSQATFYVNISGICLRDTIDASRRFMDAAHGRISTFVAHVPFYFPIGPAEIERYYDLLAEAVAGPLMLYNIPQTTKVAIPVDIVKKFVSHPKIVGLKDSDREVARLDEVLKTVGGNPDFTITVGNGLLATEGIKRGASGVVVSGGNIVPDLWVKWWNAALAARAGRESWTRVEQIQADLDVITKSYMSKGLLGQGIAAMKDIMARKGLCTNMVLPPLMPATS